MNVLTLTLQTSLKTNSIKNKEAAKLIWQPLD